MEDIGRIVIVFGIVLIIVGSAFWFLGKLPFVGKLPGDILIKRENFSFYAPIATALLISLFLSLIFTIIANLRR